MLNEKLEFEAYVTDPESDTPRIQRYLLIGKFSKEGNLYGLETILTVIARGFLYAKAGNDDPAVAGEGPYSEEMIHAAIRVLARWCGFSSGEEKEADQQNSCLQTWFEKYPEADGWLEKYWKHYCKSKHSEELWKEYEEKWKRSLNSGDYRFNKISYQNVIANALEMGPLRIRYLVFKKDENAVEERKKPDIHYLYEIQEGERSPQKSTITKFLKNIAAFLILQTYHPENQKEVLLDRRRLLNWYGQDDQKNDTSIWYLSHFLWHGDPIFWRSDTWMNLNFIKFGVNPEYLKHFDFKLIEPKSEDELKTYIKEYGDRYWILKDTGHVKNSPLCFVNNTIK